MSKRLLVLGLFILAAVGVGLAVLAATFDPNAHRATLEGYMARAVNRTVRIEGDLGLSLYPWLGLKMGPITVEERAPFAETPGGGEAFMRATLCKVRVKLLPLLDKRVVLDRVLLVEPVVRIYENATRVKNIDDIIARYEDGDGPPPPDGQTALGEDFLASFSFGGLTVMDGAVLWYEERVAEDVTVENISVDTGPGLSFPFRIEADVTSRALELDCHALLEGTGVVLRPDKTDAANATAEDGPGALAFRVVNTHLRGSVELPMGGGRFRGQVDALVDMDVLNENLVVREATVTTKGASARVNCAGKEMYGRSFIYAGEAEIISLDPDEVLAPGEMALARRLMRGARGSSAFVFDIDGVQLEDIDLDILGGSALTGQARVLGYKGFNLQSELALDRLDLKELFPPGGTGQGSSPVVLPDILRRGPSESFDVTGGLKVGSLRYGDAPGLLTTNLGGRYELDAKGLRANLAAATPWAKGLDLEASLAPDADPSRGLARLRLTAKASALDLAAVAPDQGLAGTGSGSLAFTGQGAGLGDMLGRGRLEARATMPKGVVYSPGPDREPLAFSRAEARMTLAGRGRAEGIAPWDLELSGQGRLATGGGLALDLAGPALVDALGLRLERLEGASLTARYEGDLAGLLGLVPQAAGTDGRAVRGPDMAQLQGVVDADPVAGTLFLSGGRLSALGLEARLGGEALGLKSRGGWRVNATLAVDPFRPRELAERLGRKAPETAGRGALAHCALKTELSLRPQELMLWDMLMEVDRTSLTGRAWARVRGPSDQPWERLGYGFDLRADNLDLDRYLPPRKEKTVVEDKAPEPPPQPWDLAWLEDLELEGSATAESVIYKNISYSDVALRARAGQGRLELRPVTAGFHQGELSGGMVLARTLRQGLPTLMATLDLDAEGFQVAPLMRYALDQDRGKEQLGGRGSLSASLRGMGRTRPELVASLEGRAWISVTDGFHSFVGGGVDRAEEGYDAGPDSLGPERRRPDPNEERVNRPARMAFSHANATLNVRGGVVTNDDFVMESGLLRASGQGRADLAKETVDYTISVRTPAVAAIPIRIRGDLGDPDVSVPAIGVLTETVKGLPETVIRLPETVGRIGGGLLGLVGQVLTAPFRVLGAAVNATQGPERDRDDPSDDSARERAAPDLP